MVSLLQWRLFGVVGDDEIIVVDDDDMDRC